MHRHRMCPVMRRVGTIVPDCDRESTDTDDYLVSGRADRILGHTLVTIRWRLAHSNASEPIVKGVDVLTVGTLHRCQ